MANKEGDAVTDVGGWTDPDAIDGTCDQCGEERKVIWAEDPYIAELYPEEENPEAWWCGTCFGERKDDI